MLPKNRRSNGRGATASISRGPPSSPTDGKDHLHLNVKVSSNKLRQATSGRSSANSDRDPGGEFVPGKRTRGGRKNYVLSSDSDEDEDEDEDADMEDPGDEDAEGEADEDTMDIDAEGEEEEELGDEDADGEEDVDMLPAPPVITVSMPAPAKFTARAPVAPLKSSDDELSELDSDEDIEDMDDTMQVDAEGEEDAEGEDDDDIRIPTALATGAAADEELHSDEDDDDMSRAETPNVSKMTKRQRARFEDEPQQYMKLSDEVQVKKHLTAEEQSMRRAEMARRRRNLSEKRTEEVKMETINKLLKKQAPKTNRKAGQGEDGSPEDGFARANPMFVRWVSNKDGNRVGVPDEMITGPVGSMFVGGGPSGPPAPRRPLIEEVS